MKEDNYKPEPVKRRQDSSLIARWTYMYFNDMASRGFKKELTMDDFSLIEDEDRCEQLSGDLYTEFQRQHSKRNGLVSALVKLYGWRYLIAGFLSFVETLVQIGLGFFLGKLLQWFQQPDGNQYDGYYYAGAIGFLSFSHGCLHHCFFFLTMRLGMQVRIALIASIYRKCLALSLSNSQSTGHVVNLVSNDVQRFEDFSPFGNYIWVVPIQTALTMYMIYREIGWVFVAPLAALILLVPLQSLFGTLFGKYRKQAVHFRDEKIKNISDMLSGIMVVKLYAWEKPFIAMIQKFRNLEIKWIWKGNTLKALNEAIFFFSPGFINAITYLTFFYIGGRLNPSNVFSVFAYIQFLKLSVTNFFPKAVQMGSECLVSIQRVEEFLSTPDSSTTINKETESKLFKEVNDPNVIAAIKDGTFGWTDLPVLSNINLNLKPKELTAIVGPVGSGKSSLLNVFLRDLKLKSGQFAMKSLKVAYVSQSTWILSGTIKDNILFGQSFDEQKFRAVVSACCLDTDLELFPNAENTILGEKGVTLSGGQRARVSLARAVYYDADLYLLDDPLSAVDTRVGRLLFQNCIKTTLAQKSVILVTHQLQFLNECDRVGILEDGKLSFLGSFREVLDSTATFAETIREFSNKPLVEEEEEYTEFIAETANIGKADDDDEGEVKALTKEDVIQGNVPLSMYVEFFKAGSGWASIVFMLCLLILGQASILMSDLWLSYWASQNAQDQKQDRFPMIYIVLTVVTIIISLGRAILFFYLSLRSTQAAFLSMLKSVFRSPISFFQSVPHGRLMNRFSKDVNLMDEMLPQVFFDFIQCFFLTLACLLLAGILVPVSLVLLPFLFALFYYLRSYYMKSSRQIKRFEAITRSPVYSNLSSTLEGIAIIRAFSAQNRFQTQFFKTQNENTRMFFMFLSASRWLGFRLDMLSALLLILFTFGSVLLRASLSTGSAGLLLSYLMQLTGLLQWCMRQSAELENLMISTERVFEYSKLPSEATDISSTRPPETWPSDGKLEIENMSLTYPNLENPEISADPVLKEITITFEPGLKVGIVGRTGAGKSSFLQALFRIVEPSPEQSIKLDGIATSELGLFDLRSRISIIPQEPFCFKGTIRFNLDPFDQYTDEQLWSVLEAVELKQTLMASPDKLDSEVTENGSNWSVGERQLICLARAILRNSKLIVMDEATSNVDVRTDQLIQTAIRSSSGLFSNSTVLTIAHRLNTVIDYDRILVLDRGRVVEYGKPWDLLQKDVTDDSAWFARMVQEMGEEAQDTLRKIAMDVAQSENS